MGFGRGSRMLRSLLGGAQVVAAVCLQQSPALLADFFLAEPSVHAEWGEVEGGTRGAASGIPPSIP